MSNSFCFREKKNKESIAKSTLLLPLYKDYSTAPMMLSTRDMVISWARQKRGSASP